MTETNVDRQVVQMVMESDGFEAKAKSATKALESLKEGLNLEGAVKGLQKFTESANAIDLSKLAQNVQGLADRFSVLGIAGATVITDITRAVENTAKKIADQALLAGAREGWQKFGEQMTATQTIMSSTGESVENVDKALKELNQYSDQTIYSFADMTQNIGKFTNAGVNLKDSVTAIKGISNAAALAGANAGEASRAMYNFAQALSSGYVKLIDWKSIENANMATVGFKNALLDSAVAMGTLTKAGDKYVTQKGLEISATQNFNDSLQQQWMTNDVLISTLQKYTDMSTDLGRSATEAATKVKTFSQMISVLKEAIGTGWTQSFGIIFGNFEQTRDFFTDLTNTLSSAITAFTNARNGFLEGVFGKASSFSNEGFRKAYDGLLNAANDAVSRADWLVIKEAGLATEELKNQLLEAGVAAGTLTKKEGEYITASGMAVTASKNFALSLNEGWLSSATAADKLVAAEEKQMGAATQSTKVLEKYKDQILEVAEAKGVLDTSLSKEDQWNDLIQNGKLTSDILTEVSNKMKDSLAKSTSSAKSDITDLSEAVFECGMTYKEVAQVAQEVIRGDYGNGQERVDALTAWGYDYATVQSYVNYLLGWQGEATEEADYYWQTQLKMANATGEAIDMTSEEIEELLNLQKAAEEAGMSIEDYVSMITRPSGRELFVSSITNSLAALGKVAVAVKEALKEAFPFNTGAAYNILATIEKITRAMIMTDETSDKLKRTLRGLFSIISIALTPIKIITTIIGAVVKTIPKVNTGILSVTASVGDFFYNLKNLIYQSEIFEKIANAMRLVLEPLGKAIGFVAEKIGSAASWVLEWLNMNKFINDVLKLNTSAIKDQVDKWGLFDKVSFVLGKVADAFKYFYGLLKEGFEWFKGLPIIQTILDVFSSTFDTVSARLGVGAETISSTFKEFIDRVKEIDKLSFGNILNVLSDFGSSVISRIVGVFKYAGKPIIDAISKIVNAIVEDWKVAFSNLGEFVNGISDSSFVKPVVNIFESIKEFFTNIIQSDDGVVDAVEKGESIFDKVIGFFKKIGESLPNAMDTVQNGVDRIIEFLQHYAGVIILLISAFGINKAINTIANTAKSFIKVLDKVASGINSALKGVKHYMDAKAISTLTGAFKNLAEAILIIAAAMFILGSMDDSAVERSIHALVNVSLLLGIMMFAMVGITKLFKAGAPEIGALAGAMIAFGAAIFILVQAMKGLETLENVNKDIAIMAGLMVGLIAALMVVAVMGPQTVGSALAILTIAFALKKMVDIFHLIDTMDVDNLNHSIEILMTLISQLFLVMLASRVGGGVQSGTAILAVCVGMLLIIHAMKQIADMDPAGLLIALVTIKSLFISLSMVLLAVRKAGEDANKAGVFLIGVGIAIVLIAKAITELSVLTPEQVATATNMLLKITVFISAFLFLSNLAGDNIAKAGPGLVGFSAAVLLLTGAVYLLGKMPLDIVAQGTAVLAAISFMMYQMMIASEKANGSLKTIIGITASVAVIALMIAALSAIPHEDLIIATACVFAIMGMLTMIMYASQYVKNVKKSDLITIGVLFEAVVWSFYAFHKAMGKVNPSELMAEAGALAIVMLAMSASMLLINKASKGVKGSDAFKSALATAGSFLVLAIAAGVAIKGVNHHLSGVNLVEAAKQMSLVGVVILAMEGLASVAGVMGKGISERDIGKTALAISVSMIPLVTAAALAIMAVSDLMDGKDITKTAEQLALVGVVIGAMELLMVGVAGISKISSFGSLTSTSLDISGGISVIVLAMTALIAGLGAIADEIDSHFGDGFVVSKIQSGMEIIQAITDGVAELIGSALSKLGEGLTSSLPQMGLDIEQFASRMSMGLSLLGLVDKESISKIGDIIGSIAELVESGWLYSIEQFFGGYSFEEMATEFGKFAEGLNKFANDLNLDSDSLDKASKAATAISNLCTALNDMPRINGLVDMFAGVKMDGDDFKNQMSSFAGALKAFHDETKDLDGEAITHMENASGAAKALFDMAKEAPKEGGWAQKIFGETDLGNFAEDLKDFGIALTDYSNSVNELDDNDLEQMERAKEAAQKLVDLSTTVGPSGGLLQNLVGNADLESFGKTLTPFALGLNSFCTILEWLPDDQLDRFEKVKTATQFLVDLANSLEPTGGLIPKLFTGDMDLSKLGSTLTDFGRGLSNFCTELKGTDDNTLERFSKAADAVSALVTMGNEIENRGGVLVTESGLGMVGNALVKFAQEFKTFTAELEGVDDKAYMRAYNAALAAEAIGNLSLSATTVSTISEMSTDGFATNIENIAKGLNAFVTNFDSDSEISDSILGQFASVCEQISSVNVDDISGATEQIASIVDSMMKLTELDSSSLKGISEGMAEMATNTLTAFAEGINDNLGEMDDAITSIYDYIDEGLNGQKISLKLLGGVIAGFVASGISGSISAKTAASTLASSMASTIRGYYTSFYSAGVYLNQGVANGMIDRIDIATNASNQVGLATLRALKKALNEASPSKESTLYGEYITVGLANGILNMASLAEDAGIDVAESTLKAVENTLDYISYAVDNYEFNSPVITPVLDMSNLKMTSQDIQATLSANQATAISNMETTASLDMKINDNIDSLIEIGKATLEAIREGGDIYLNENLIIGRINRRLGMI